MALEPGQQVAQVAQAPRRQRAWCKVLLCAAVVAAACLARGGLASEVRGDEEVADPAAGAVGRRLSTSTKCRQALEAMLTNEHWNYMNHSYTRWCRIKAENEMARCCGVADFAQGRGEDCLMTRMSGSAVPTECFAKCWHNDMSDFCSAHFGRACTVERTIFADVELVVAETFCVPEACDNANDRDNLMNWYSTLYANRLSGWHKRWDQAVLNCPNTAIGALLYTLLALVLIPIVLLISYFLFVAPKERGRLLKSQEEMQKEADGGTSQQESLGDLRGTAQLGHDALGQSFGATGMSRSR